MLAEEVQKAMREGPGSGRGFEPAKVWSNTLGELIDVDRVTYDENERCYIVHLVGNA